MEIVKTQIQYTYGSEVILWLENRITKFEYKYFLNPVYPPTFIFNSYIEKHFIFGNKVIANSEINTVNEYL